MRTLGIEFGSTRIKGVVLEDGKLAATASFAWESSLYDGLWTYALDDIWDGFNDVLNKLGGVDGIDAMGVSAMMHGYLAFDKDGELLTPFRTWKNTNTEQAAAELSELFDFNVPVRWSVAHLYRAILNNEEHVKQIDFVTTLAGYVHWRLTGEKTLGVGDASGMFPLRGNDYDPVMAEKFKKLTGFDVAAIFPKILLAGEKAGTYNGVAMCPPEGDAGTGMVATNAFLPRTGNVSAGTSVFAMVVLEKPLAARYKQIDVVATPWGLPVAMAHANECCSLVDPWVRLFGGAAKLMGASFSDAELFAKLYECAVADDSPVSAFMRGKLAEACAELKDGLRILTERENVVIDNLAGHGGYFKSGNAGRAIMSQELGIPVSLAENAAEGGAFGIATLAGYVKD